VVALAGAARLLVRRVARSPAARERALVALTWLVVPVAAVGLGPLQTQRYLTPTMPAVAVLFAGVVTRVRPVSLRRLLVALAIGGGALEALLLTVPWDPPGLPTAVTFPTPLGEAQIPLAGQDLGYNHLAVGTDYATPIVEYLEGRSRKSDGTLRVSRIGILRTTRATNRDTLWLVQHVRGDRFVFDNVKMDPAEIDQLPALLARYDFVLHVPDAPDPPTPRIGLLNETRYASAFVTPELLAQFAGPIKTLPIGSGKNVEIFER
jgi:hypothetical protein